VRACILSSTDTYKLLPLYIIDPEEFKQPDSVGVNRLAFLLEALVDLDRRLAEGLGLRLVVAKGPPKLVLKKLYRKFEV